MKLDDTLCYLVGAIDRVADQGKGWRREVVFLCRTAGLKIKFLDPTNKVTGLQNEVDEEHQRVLQLKNEGKWDELSVLMEKIVRHDHRAGDLSDFIIFYIEPDVHTCGSYFELQSALTQKKPYFIIVKGGKKNLPSWLFGILDHNCVFDSVEDVVLHLMKLDNGEISMSDRWVIFRQQIKEL